MGHCSNFEPRVSGRQKVKINHYRKCRIQLTLPDILKAMIRVTKLGEFSPSGRLFTKGT
jgi:hypothetical protein